MNKRGNPLGYKYDINVIMEIERKHTQFKHPSNILVVGMSGSGKTELIRRILKSYELQFYNLNKPRIKVLWSYGQWHSLIDIKLSENVDVIYEEGIPPMEHIEQIKPDIIVIDDLLFEMNKQKDFENIFIKKSHHLNISVIFSVQNLFYNSKSMRTISLNCHYIILMKNPRDKTQIASLARQIYSSNMNFLIDAYNDATQSAYGYIRIDLSPDTPEEYRVMSRITPDEVNNRGIIPILYKPKYV